MNTAHVRTSKSRALTILAQWVCFVIALAPGIDFSQANARNGSLTLEIFQNLKTLRRLELPPLYLGASNLATREEKLKIVRDYALQLVGTPYVYGGDDPMKGFDCSGIVIELLQAYGLLPYGYDNTSQGLYTWAITTFDTSLRAGLGALAFFGKSVDKISHVAWLINDELMLEAGGGTSKIKTIEDAIAKNAYIRIRPLTWRKDLRVILMPNY